MENLKEKKFQLETLTCPSCITKIEGMLTKHPGVKEAKVLFHSNKVKVAFRNNETTEDQIKESIEGLGYPVLS